MSCAIFTILAVVAHYWKKTDRWVANTIFVFAVILLFFASYEAWRDEFMKTHPGLHLVMDAWGTGTAPEGMGVVVLAGISNLGSPSIADEWMLEMIPVNGSRPTKIPPMIIPQDRPLELHFDAVPSLAYDPKDALYIKVASTPLPTGAKETGFLLFHFKGIGRDQSNIPGTKYRLTCRDVAGNEVSVEWKATGEQFQKVPYFPGITEPRAAP